MAAPKRNAWSAEDDAQVRALGGTVPDANIAAILHRDEKTISRHRNALGIAPFVPPSPWTADLDARLTEMVSAGKGPMECSATLGFSIGAVNGRSKRLGLWWHSMSTRKVRPRSSNDFRWTDEAIATLSRMWAEGHSAEAIGRFMGVGKNAVIGKANRLRLDKRGFPVRGVTKRPAVALSREPRDTLPPVWDAAHGVEIIRQKPRLPLPRFSRLAAVDARGEEPTERTPFAPKPLRAPPNRSECCWPMWGQERPTHVYCCEPAERGSYCGVHAVRAYGGGVVAQSVRAGVA